MTTDTRKAGTTSLSVRLTENEIEMLDKTCQYQRVHGKTVLGEPDISRADALRKLAALGYKRVERAAREAERARHAAGDTRPPRDTAPGLSDAGIKALAARLHEAGLEPVDTATRAARRSSDRDPTDAQMEKCAAVTELSPADLIRLGVAVAHLHADCAGVVDDPDPLARLRRPEVSALISLATALNEAGEPGTGSDGAQTES